MLCCLFEPRKARRDLREGAREREKVLVEAEMVGVIRAHAASLRGCVQRGWKGQPEGGFAGDGTSPGRTMRWRFASGSGTGTADRSACVYGMSGSR